MADRRSLTEGLKATPGIDPAVAKEFVRGSDISDSRNSAVARDRTSAMPSHNRVPISTRMRADFAAALKRASLERQLKGVEPNSLTDIIEQAVEPWLKNNGYIP